MDPKSALRSQYLSGLRMLKQAVNRCPDDLWIAGEHPRNFWRIAYHTAFYTHLYLSADNASFVPWKDHRDGVRLLWGEPQVVEPYTRKEILRYIEQIIRCVGPALDAMDLDRTESGFSWYPNMSKFEHQLVNLRHLGGHVGQLSELLMAHGFETDWISRRAS